MVVLCLALVAGCNTGGGRVDVPDPTGTPPPSPTATHLPFRATQTRAPERSLSATPNGPTGPTQQARVTDVHDGDTITVLIGAKAHPLRYIGIDAPESGGPYVSVEPLQAEATRANRLLVDGQDVVLEMDVSERDRFDRLLRHVWVAHDDGWLLVSEELLRQGLGSVTTFPPDVKYVDRFRAAQSEAQRLGLGIWSTETVPRPGPATAPPGTRPVPLSGERCHPSYPGVCIPPSPPDLDCGDIVFRRFTVLPPDPHRFDGNGDGVGCESP